jgi:hypothetical protein
LEAAIDEPPRKFTIKFCVEDMERQYKALTGNELGSETSDGQMGICRKCIESLEENGGPRKRKMQQRNGKTLLISFHMSHATLFARNL